MRKSYVTPLFEFMEDITEAIDNGKGVDVIHIDFCKAFDKVPHRPALRGQLEIVYASISISLH